MGALFVWLLLAGLLLWTAYRFLRMRGAAHAQEHLMAALISGLEEAVLTADSEGRVTAMNGAAEHLTGWSQAEARGRNLGSVAVVRQAETRPAVSDPIQPVFRDGTLVEWLEPMVLIARDGIERPVAGRAVPLRRGAGRSVGALLVLRDLTERKRTERLLALHGAIARELAGRCSADLVGPTLLNLICQAFGWPVGLFWRVDGEFGMLRCAHSWIGPGGRADALGAAIRTIALPSGVGLAGRVWANGKPLWLRDAELEGDVPQAGPDCRMAIGVPITVGTDVVGVLEFMGRDARRPDGDLLAAMASIGRHVGLFLQHQHLEGQFLQAQKTEVVGRVAGSVAHDVNNLLTVIRGYSEQIMGRAVGDDRLARDLTEIGLACERASELVQRLLSFGRPQTPVLRIMDLNEAVREIEGLLRSLLVGESVKLALRLGLDAGPIEADRAQVEQLLMNLAINARDAMPEGGDLVVQTAAVHVAAQDVSAPRAVPPGDYVALSVTDTGQGMDERTKAHIFEPFFTTKAPGKGTGLGLTTVSHIVQQSRGAIEVISEVGQGTTFRIYWPRAAGVWGRAPSPSASAVA